MAISKHFHTNGIATIAAERNLYNDLVAEAIQIYGHDVHYIDRVEVSEDTILGEDALSKFEHARKIEMYVEDNQGWGGNDLLMSKFGLQDMSEVTFTVSVNRFRTLSKQISIESATDDSGGAILQESGTIGTTSFEGEEFYIIKDTEPTGLDRPYEGDLIFHPIFKMLFEIKSVEDEEPFYQLDNLPVYKMACQIFDYSSETLDTGITEIDEIQDQLSLASSDHQVTLEQAAGVTINQGIHIHHSPTEIGLLLDETDGDKIIGEDETDLGGESILLETGGDEYIIQETYIIGQGTRGDDDLDRQAQNELFDTLDDTVLDFTESNPFGDAGSIN